MLDVFRVLLIEDDGQRIETVRSWLPEEMRLVVATSVGMAMGLLQRTRKGDYGAIMLDHDLQGQARTEADKVLSGSNLMNILIEKIGSEVPVLIHSRSRSGSRYMSRHLIQAGFAVTCIPMDELTKERLRTWIDGIVQEWRDER